MPLDLDALLREAVSKEASDIHLKVGVKPNLRIHGALVPVEQERLTAADLDAVVAHLLTGPHAGKVKDKFEIDLAYTLAGVSRFRCNIFRQRGSLEIVMRTVPYNIPTIEELGLPPVLSKIALESRGLVLVTGITGSGKSTTIASMINNLNKNMPVHIVTIEDPIEFVYRDEMASITQREVGIDTETFHDALKYVLRQDPDVIVLGEMRDRETAQTAMTAAETGHLVFSTLHTADCIQTIDRLVDLFPADQHDQIRHSLASTLKAVISMRLIEREGGGTMVPAVEVMTNTPAIRSLIEENKLSEIKQLIAEGASQYGMQTFDQSLLALYRAKLISRESALEEATSSAEVELAMRGITVGTVSAQNFMRGSDDSHYKNQAREYYLRAARQFNQGLLDDATQNVKKALNEYPEYAEALDLKKKIEEKSTLEKTRTQSSPVIKMALDLIAHEKYPEAIAALKNGLASDPGNEKMISMIKGAQEKIESLKDVKPLLDKANALARENKIPEARAAFEEILSKEPYNNEAITALGELIQAGIRHSNAAEIASLSRTGEESSAQKRWFDAIMHWILVREIQPDHQMAIDKLTEAGAQLKLVGLPGIPAQAPWAAALKQSFEKGLAFFLSGQAGACLSEWRGIASRVPEAVQLIDPFISKVRELNASHVTYHIDRAKHLLERGELGRAMQQLRHALQLDPQSVDARAIYDSNSHAAESKVREHIANGEKWLADDKFRQGLFQLERAAEIDPGREGLKQKIAELKSKLDKRVEAASAMVRPG